MDKLTVIQKLFAAYPNTTASAATHAVYLEVLAELSTEQLNTVVMQCIREGGNFPPSAGQILQKWQAVNAPPTDGAEQGWLSVQMAMRDPLNYVPEPSPFVPKFRDPIVGKVVAAMGWYNLRMSEAPRVDQAQFVKMYNAFAEREASEHRLSSEFKQLRDDNRRAVESLSQKQLLQQTETNGHASIIKRLSN